MENHKILDLSGWWQDMTSISVDQLSLSTRGKAGEWYDHRGGSRVVRDIQAGITHESMRFICQKAVAKSTLVGNSPENTMPQMSTLVGAFSGIANMFLVALDFCRTDWNEKKHLEQNWESDCPRLRTIPQMWLAPIALHALHTPPCSARCILDTSEKRKRIRISIGPGKMNSGWSGFCEFRRKTAQWQAENLLHFHFGFLMSPPKKSENSWDSLGGRQQWNIICDRWRCLGCGWKRSWDQKGIISILIQVMLTCIFSKVLENSAQQNPCSFRHSRAGISDFVVKDRSEMLTTYEHDFGPGCPGLVDVTKIDLSTFGKIQIFHTRMFRMSPVLMDPPSSKGPQQIDM